MISMRLRIAKYYWTYIKSVVAKHRRPRNATKNLLIVKTDGLGDFFLFIPFLQKLVSVGYKIHCIGNGTSETVIKHLGIPITFDTLDNTSYAKMSELLNRVAAAEYEYAINLSMNIWGGFLVNQSRSRFKYGLLQEREYYVYKGSNLFYDKKISYPPLTHNFNVLENLFHETIRLQHVPKEIATSLQNKGYILIHPYSSWQPKIWPYYSDLIKTLTNQGHTIHVIGIVKEHTTNEWLPGFTHSDKVHIVTLTSITVLLEEIENATAFIGNDSGPAHYSALIGKPTTVLWGGASFERIHPVGPNVTFCKVEIDCRPCRQKGDTCIRGENECLKKITTNDVINALSSSLH
jgi:ADP-heptose:LPS heptosyltransferase